MKCIKAPFLILTIILLLFGFDNTAQSAVVVAPASTVVVVAIVFSSMSYLTCSISNQFVSFLFKPFFETLF